MSRTARSAGRVTRRPPSRSASAPVDGDGDGAPSEVTLTVRVDLGQAGAIGPGKVRLLELIADTGSISAAGRAMGMSYRQAWLLIDSLNRSFREPAVATLSGGPRGGGAELTPFGQDLIAIYRRIEAAAVATTTGELAALAARLQGGKPVVVAARAPKRGSRKKRS